MALLLLLLLLLLLKLVLLVMLLVMLLLPLIWVCSRHRLKRICRSTQQAHTRYNKAG